MKQKERLQKTVAGKFYQDEEIDPQPGLMRMDTVINSPEDLSPNIQTKNKLLFDPLYY